MATKRGQASRGPWRSEQVRRIATPLVRLGSGAVVVACFVLIAAHLAGVAQQDPRFLVNPSLVLDESRPEWLPRRIASGVRADLARVPPISIFADGFRDVMADALVAASPWIAEVRNVERLFPNRARVEMVLRRPVIAVEHGSRRYLVDESLLVIHEESRSLPLDFGFAVLPVQGVRLDPPPRVGELLTDPEALSAIQVAMELQGLEEPLRSTLWQVRPVALSVRRSVQGSVAARGEVHLTTAGGVLVEWGRAQSSLNFGHSDVPVATKIDHLRRILERFPRLDGLEEVRLNFDHPQFRPIREALYTLDLLDPLAESESDS